MTRARWIVADGAHRGVVGSRESARLIARVEQPAEPSATTEDEAVADSPSSAPAPTQRVDLNNASLAELDTLPGVGPAIAERIVEERPYSTLADLQRVRGIGPATLERIRPHAVVHAVDH
jgi:competence protein ComEA